MGAGFCNFRAMQWNTDTPLSQPLLQEQRSRESSKVGREEERLSSNRPELVALRECLEAHEDHVDLLYLTDSEASLQAIHKWIGCGAKLNLSKSPDADILKDIILKLQKRVEAGAATLLIKVKAHRGDPLNEEADIRAELGRQKAYKETIWDDSSGRTVYQWPVKQGRTKALKTSVWTDTLKEKIRKLTELLAGSKVPGATQRLALLSAHTSKLAVYDETKKVANILKEMRMDIKTRRDVIDRVDAGAKKLLDDCTDKMTEWAGQASLLLANAKDKAKAEQDRMKLEREKLSGDYHVVEIAATEDEKTATKMIGPYEREIYVITMIKKKIIDKCNGGSWQ